MNPTTANPSDTLPSFTALFGFDRTFAVAIAAYAHIHDHMYLNHQLELRNSFMENTGGSINCRFETGIGTEMGQVGSGLVGLGHIFAKIKTKVL